MAPKKKQSSNDNSGSGNSTSTNTVNVTNELKSYIRSGKSGIYIVSYEEVRVELELKAIATELGWSINVWSITEGIVNVTDNPPTKIIESQHPMSMLDEFHKMPEQSILIARDFHLMLKGDKSDPDPQLIRKIKDELSAGQSENKAFIIVGCQLHLPPELEKEMAVVEFKLPDRSQLRITAEGISKSAGIDAPDNGKMEKLIDAASGLTTTEASDAFALSIVEAKDLVPDIVTRVKAATVKKNGVLEIFETTANIDDIGGLGILKEWLKKRCSAFSKKAKEFGLPTPKGVLAVGIAGSGKSLSAKATASIFGVPLLKLDAGRIFGSMVGESEKNMRTAIQTAEAVAPCILWVDEIEKGFSGSKSSGSTDGGTSSRVFGTFLQWMNDKTCYDERTEILTDSGWKPFADLTGGERIATRSKNKELEWQHPTRFVRSRHDGRMVRFHSKTTDMLVTPDHQMLAQFCHPGRIEKEFLVPACQIVGKRYAYKVPVKTSWACQDRSSFTLPGCSHERRRRGKVVHPAVCIEMDAWLAFLGIYISEGWVTTGPLINEQRPDWRCSYYRIGISQTKPDVRREIECLLAKLPFKWRQDADSYMCNDIRLHKYLSQLGKCSEKHIPSEFMDLPTQRLEVLWQWLLKGDGNVTGNRMCYTTTSARLAGNIQELLLKLGFEGAIQTKPPGRGGKIRGREIVPRRTTYVVTKRTAPSRSLCGQLEDYHGEVFCVTVPNGVVYTRRNGKPTWSGNSPVFVFATANDISQLPPEFLRKGRFDELFFVDLPSTEERSDIWRVHISKKGRNPDKLNLAELAQRTEGFTGAEIEAVVNEGMFTAFSEDTDLQDGHLLDAVRNTVPLSRTKAQEIDALRAWANGRARRASVDANVPSAAQKGTRKLA